MTETERLEHLIRMIKSQIGNMNMQAIILQAYIQEYGPVPAEYADRIRNLMV